MSHATRRKRKEVEDSSTTTTSFYNNTKGSFVIPNKRQHQPQQLRGSINNNININNNTNNNNINISNSTNNNGGSTTSYNNQLLAGYMAHEFLTRGTLFGQKFDPARAEAVPLAAADHSSSKRKEPEPGCLTREVNKSYADVARLLMSSDGAHIPGVFNPSQLARWIQM